MSATNLPFGLAGDTGNDPAAGDVPPPEDPRELILSMILLKLDQLTALVAGSDDATILEVPPLPGANSLAGILNHCCAMARHWTSTVDLGREVPRDREGEFTVRLTVAEATDLARTTSEALTTDVRRTELAAPPAVPQHAEGEFWATTCHGVLLHVLEEICQHLGHAEMTRDLLAAGAVHGDRPA